MKVYLAPPYSHENPAVRELRFMRINEIAAMLMASGGHVYSPISHTHPIAEAGDLPQGWDFWEQYDRHFIEWCDSLYVYCADGWKESKGVNAEIQIARELGKPIVFMGAR
jgi:hypothetical protein